MVEATTLIPEIAIVLAILVATVVMFVTERIRVDMATLMVLASLALTGLVTPAEAPSGFADLAVVTVWAVLILSVGLARAGEAGQLVPAIVGKEGTAGGHRTMAGGQDPLGSRYAEQVVLEINQRALQALQVRPDVAGEPLIRVARTSRVLIRSRHTSPDQTVERRSVARIALGLLVGHPFRSSFPRHLDGRARYAVSHTRADGLRPSEKPNNDLIVPKYLIENNLAVL